MHSPRHTLVSNSLPIGGKRETNGNENGNEAETKGVFLCRNGNEMETKDGNESRLSVALVSNRDKITEQPFMQIAHQSAQPRNDDDGGSLPDRGGHPPRCSGVSLDHHPQAVRPTAVFPERDAFNPFP